MGPIGVRSGATGVSAAAYGALLPAALGCALRVGQFGGGGLRDALVGLGELADEADDIFQFPVEGDDGDVLSGVEG
eukprot:4155524-Pyramimonas_sp.AAC.1